MTTKISQVDDCDTELQNVSNVSFIITISGLNFLKKFTQKSQMESGQLLKLSLKDAPQI